MMAETSTSPIELAAADARQLLELLEHSMAHTRIERKTDVTLRVALRSHAENLEALARAERLAEADAPDEETDARVARLIRHIRRRARRAALIDEDATAREVIEESRSLTQATIHYVDQLERRLEQLDEGGA